MEIKNIVHEHPLTLCENANGGQVLCHGCGDPSFGESYSCNSCGFHPETCSCCERQPSGHCSVYICEQCWPQSPLFHQSCLDLPEEIQITYRPGCSLKIMKQSSDQSEELYVCDYCNEMHESFKYGCADCDFQIGIGCASKFIKYHQGQQHIEHFSHSHPLALMVQLHDKMECMFCSKSINGGQGYGCAPCEFYIHNSCRDKFPEEIRRRSFHRQYGHTYLKICAIEEPRRRCDACCFDIQGLRYECNKCNFSLHPECSESLKPQIKYSGHEHLLILVENSSYEGKCKSCGFNVKGIFFMRCVECMVDFHVQCGAHPTLPPTVCHKEHQHPLILVTSSDSQLLSCKICSNEIKPDSSYYCCADANPKHDQYVAHPSCAITQLDFDEKVNLKHFSHDEHILTFREMDEDDHTRCRGCLKAIQGPTYGCDYCHFFLHKSCVELPRYIRLQSHSHYLTLQASDTLTKSPTCDNCNKNFYGFMYNCSLCTFKLDLDCVSGQPLENLNHEDGKRIEHFCHAHPLITLEVAGANCEMCCKNINGQCWGCAECEFHIHTTCAELPKEVKHPFHPWHSLTLSNAEKYSSYSCDACRFEVQGFRYRCSLCEFDLHPECRSLKPTIEYNGHDHLLTLIENLTYNSECKACGFEIWGTFFLRCVACFLDFHVQCGPDQHLPTAILHQQHEHSFALIAETRVLGNSDQLFCVVCKDGINPEHPCYCCADCDCYAHVRCVITKVHVDKGEKIQHFSHRHKLLIFENKRSVDIVCSACENGITADGHLTYGCDPCRFYLHQSCANLPRDLQHPFHRHKLSLSIPYNKICDACHKRFQSFRYGCEDCDFKLDLKCSSLHPSIKNESVHEHTLTFFNKLYGDPKCDHCQSLIQPNELTALDDWFIRCLKCDFNLHLICCPLPQTIAHPCHLHCLSLTDKCAQLSNHCFEDKYYCDYCETIRSGQECVYYCDRCNFVVDLDCVLPEVMHFLQGKQINVQPKHVRDRRRNNSYKDIIETLTREERKMMEDTLANFLQQLKGDMAKDRTGETKEKKKGSQMDIFKELKEIDERISDLLPAVVKGLIEKEAKEHVQEILKPDYIAEAAKAELVNLGDYKIIPELEPVLQKVLDKHKDIGDCCGLLTPNLKTITLVILCGIIHSMRTTKVCDIDGESIIMWWFLLKFIENIGFKIDFVLDHLKRVAADYFLIVKDDEIENRPLYEIREKITELYEEIDDLKKRTQKIICDRSTQRSRNEATRLNKALRRWWKTVAAVLLEDI